MKTRYFVRVVKPFGNYRTDHEVCLEEDEYSRAKDAVVLTATEVDGKIVAPEAPVEAEPDEEKPKKPKAK